MTSWGLRERKKRKTRWLIQEHALALFEELGYDATTVDQIADAAEVSPSTFFRYFKTKEDVVLEDEYDPLIERSIAAAPPGLPLLPALRHGFRDALMNLDATERHKALIRSQLTVEVPALRMRLLDNLTRSSGVLTSAIAQRLGRPADDPRVRVLGGAFMGVLVIAMFDWIESGGGGNLAEVLDSSLAELESALAAESEVTSTD